MQDGQITLDEFKKAVQMTCMGRRFEDFPQVGTILSDT